jgi:hypothetical protein
MQVPAGYYARKQSAETSAPSDDSIDGGSGGDDSGFTQAGSGSGNGGSSGYYKVRTPQAPAGGGSGYYKVGTPQAPAGAESGSHGYYKARTPGSSDFYGTNTAGAPQYQGASDKDIRALGREPQLQTNGGQASPDGPQPVVINQATTQDLSLPEDDTTYRYQPTPGAVKFGKAVGKGVGKVLQTPANMVGGYAGMHFGK